jgi:hypothetical protein
MTRTLQVQTGRKVERREIVSVFSAKHPTKRFKQRRGSTEEEREGRYLPTVFFIVMTRKGAAVAFVGRRRNI